MSGIYQEHNPQYILEVLEKHLLELVSPPNPFDSASRVLKVRRDKKSVLKYRVGNHAEKLTFREAILETLK